MGQTDLSEFRNALTDLAKQSVQLESEYDRVRCCEWIRKLISLPNDNEDNIKLKNDYIQYLRIVVRTGFLHGIFLKMPPKGKLKPFPEAVGDQITGDIEDLPPVGPMSPTVIHTSKDGRAQVSIRKLPDSGVVCYLSVTPQPLL